MKKANTISMAAAIVSVIAVAGIAGISMAQSDNASESLEPGTGFGARMHMGILTDEEKTELKARWEARMAEKEARHEAVEAAVETGDYQAWLTAVGEDSQMAQEVTEEEFPKLRQAHELREQARGLMEEIGIEQGMGKFGGKGFGHGMRGMGKF